jgi:hypothetical protein
LESNKETNISTHYELVATAFTALEIAQPIKVIALPTEPLLLVWERLMELDIREDWCCLVQDENHTFGYLSFEDALWDQKPLEGTVADELDQINPEMMVPASLPLLDLVPLFNTSSLFYFLLSRNSISHVVSFYDLDKLPFKLCLFSLFLQLESQLLDLFTSDPSKISTLFNLLSESRQLKARDLCRSKYKEITPVRLLLCTTFVDKKEMLIRSTEFHARLPFKSKNHANSFFSIVETVRNQIAHSDSVLRIVGSPNELNSFINLLRSLSNALSIGK